MAKSQAAEKLYTLTEVSKKTNISMPTLQRYKKSYQDRIPSQGQGRSQRYPEAALDVFRQLKKENVSRRGRPRKNVAAAAAKPAAKPAARRGRKPAAKKARKPAAKPAAKRAAKPAAKKGGGKLLTLTQISETTGISYPTLLRYVKMHLKNIPHEGTGRGRRFKPEAVAVFKDLRSKSKRGRKPKAVTAAAAAKSAAKPARRGRPPKKAAAKPAARRGRPPKVVDPKELAARLKEVEKINRQLVRQVERIQKKLAKTPTVVWR